MMTRLDRITLLAKLGTQLDQSDERLDAAIRKTHQHNRWLTEENTRLMLTAIREELLDEEKLKHWANQYSIPEGQASKKVGLVMGGNVPLAGFQDLLCVFVAGHHAVIKLSEREKYMMPYLIDVLTEIEPAAGHYFSIVERLKDFEAIIVVGGNEDASHFQTHFQKYPNIIHKRRTSVAILDGQETDEDFKKLGKDAFRYFGLSSRNISKFYLPEGYDFVPLMRNWERYSDLIEHNKFKNNYDYNYSLLLLNNIPHYSNGSILLQENVALYARIASLNYEFYTKKETLIEQLKEREADLHYVVSKTAIDGLDTVSFGTTQNLSLHSYADDIDAMNFLLEL